MVPAYTLPGAVRFNDAVAEGARRTLARPEVGPDDIAFLQYTGGTTGVSKGATLLHRNMVANVLQLEAWVKPALADSSRGAVPGAVRLHLRAAALSRVRAGRELPCRHPARDAERADRKPARHPRFCSRARQVPFQRDPGRQHALQRARGQRGVPQARLLPSAGGERRRHGGAARGGGEVARGDRRADHRGLRSLRDLAGRDLQSRDRARIQRHDRSAVSEHRDRDPRRRGSASVRWASRARSRSAVRRSWRATGSGPTRPRR